MSQSLDEYNRKRDFDATPEPPGGARDRGGEPHALQYCIQKHDASRLHYDFRLELDGTLKSWAIPKGPSLDPTVRRLAVQVEDHPLDYATFEGHIPEGHYGAGDVIVWDRGLWQPKGDPAQAYAKGRLTFALKGEKLAGQWSLVRTHLEGRQVQWFLIKHDDEAARPEAGYDIVRQQPDSVLSERTLVPRARGAARRKARPSARDPSAGKTTPVEAATVEAATAETAAVETATADPADLPGARRAALPDSLKPELATLVESAPAGDWRYEIKFDGYRILARIEAGTVRLFTRNGHDWTPKMPHQAKALEALGLDSAWLDGEVIVLDEQGLPDFQALQNAFEAGRSNRIVYYLFDLPYLNGVDLRRVALEHRRAALATVLAPRDDAVLRLSEDFAESAESMLDSACQMHLEGLIGKRLGSPYVSRRSDDWIKLKCTHRHEFVVVGYTEPKGARSAFGALLLGLHDKDSGVLRYAGKVGTGFNEATLRSLHARLLPLEIPGPAVVNPLTGAEARGVHWLKPELLAEVAYAEMTREGVIRHSVFQGLREDKLAEAITEETPKPAAAVDRPATPARKAPAGRIRISHPDRVIDATEGTTKLQLAEYYASVADWLLPHLKDRPVALVRAPEGIAGELFFQKNAARLAIPGIETLGKEYSGQPVMLINSLQALIGAVQMSTVELHTWNATAADLERPDRFILDLDPDPALPWKSMVEAVQLVLTVLDELGLVSFLKTSGGKGIHVVVPLAPQDGWAEVKAFSQAIVRHMARLLPERFTAVSGPKNRVGRIFIDYLRNSQGATTICAFAARTREGLPVSVPVAREEVAGLKGGNAWTVHTLHARLADLEADPWAGYAAVRQTITADMRRRIGLR
ncbi:DNA ligase D [Pseudomonas mangiferae]|uniref:DNA ligase (ATP) n=1 Tax=Pseudomonas mangiferae TaxID=2593654 RepID=A0A553GVY7_9PSED|nr:DNA ligase D [Pseudomonas mangiferae]TRX73649.1 DNA ligase D [Pseudomonas mangiferae]